MNTRATAARVVERVVAGRRSLDAALADGLTGLADARDRALVQELGQYEVIAAKQLSGGIRGFGRLRMEWLAHALADRFGIRNTHGIIALRRVQ